MATMVSYKSASWNERKLRSSKSQSQGRTRQRQKKQKVSLDELVTDYSVCKRRFVEIAFSGLQPTDNALWPADMVKASVALAVGKLEIEFSKGYCEQLFVYDSPKSVYAKTKVNKGGVTLVPSSRSIGVRNADEDAPAKALDLGCLNLHQFSEKCILSAHLNAQFSATEENPWVAPFWVVFNTKTEGEKVNMRCVTKKVEVSVENMSMPINVPVLENMVVLKPGDRLVYGEEGD